MSVLGSSMNVVIADDAVPKFLMRAHELACIGQPEEALACLTEPNLRQVQDQVGVAAQIVLGQTWRMLGHLREAAECYERATAEYPDKIILAELAGLYRDVGRFSQALRCCERALLIQEEWPELKALYASCLMKMGQLRAGIEVMKGLVHAGLATAELHSQYLFHLHYIPEMDAKTVLRECRRWGALFAPRRLARTGHANAPDPCRRLRIGYLSADFRRHSVAYTFEALLDGRNPQDIEVYGYGSVARPDEVTERLAQKFDGYRDILKLDDKAVADLVERDKIDILVALAGHSTGHRLGVLAHKPAPIQVDSGSLGTTGMEQVDYRLTDRWLDPPNTQADYLEKFKYLPGGFVCYRPAPNAPAVARPPVLKNGYLTFGSFNNLLKVNDDTIGLWTRILRAVPDSRLLMKFHGSHDPILMQMIRDRFERNRISSDRLQFIGYCDSFAEHLQCFRTMDIALDTYPFNGCLTTLEGLWMGVPTLTLNGTSYVAQVGRSIMTQLGLDVFTANTPDEFVAKAGTLAQQIPVLVKLRRSLRPCMQASTVCDPQRYARELETAFRHMWTTWCKLQSGS
jgi:protein O-GlcNAc transferase